ALLQTRAVGASAVRGIGSCATGAFPSRTPVSLDEGWSARVFCAYPDVHVPSPSHRAAGGEERQAARSKVSAVSLRPPPGPWCLRTRLAPLPEGIQVPLRLARGSEDIRSVH